MTLSASGGEGNLPCLFDTANPGSQETCSNPDLGAPNEACPGGGHGWGIGGIPGTEGKNCEPLGNVLIMQEPGSDCPDDNVDGGMIIFDFDEPAEVVYSMGLLDIDYKTTVTVFHMIGEKMEETVFKVPILGDNLKQTLEINIENVKQIKLTATRSTAVIFLSFCYPPPSVSPLTALPTRSPIMASPTKKPTASPTAPPTAMPSASPSELPSASPSASP